MTINKNKLPWAPEKKDRFLIDRLKEIFDKGNLTQEELAAWLAVSQAHVSRLLGGKTPWRKKYLRRFARLYDIPLNTLLVNEQAVPIVSHIEDDNGFEYAAIHNENRWVGKVPAPPTECNLEGLYCLLIKGDFFKPFLRDGSLIYARQNPPSPQGNILVIFVDENGRAFLRQPKYSNDTIMLKSLSMSAEYITRPKIYARVLDKVEWIKI